MTENQGGDRPCKTREEVGDSLNQCAPPRRSGGLVRSALVALWVVALLAAGTWATYWAPVRNDQYQLIHLGQCVARGGRMYVDCWENKPPGITWLNALALLITPETRVAVWILPALLALAALVMFWRALRSIVSPRAARRGVVLAAAVATMRLYDAPSVNPDFYSFTFELMAVSAWLGALVASRGAARASLALLAGLLWACATTVKQVSCTGLLAISLVTLILLWMHYEGRRAWLVACIGSCVGLLVGLGVVAAVLHQRGTLGEAWQAVLTFNTGFFGDGSGSSLLSSWPRLRAALSPLRLPLWLGALGAGVILLRGGEGIPSRPWTAAMLLWGVLAAVFALLGPSHSMRYWQGAWAPLLMLVASGLSVLDGAYRAADRKHRGPLAVALITVVVMLAKPLVSHYRDGLATSYLSYTERPNERDKLAELGERLRRLVPVGQRIYVLAYDAGVYVHGDRGSASRFTYPRSAEQMREILADLSAGKAYMILVPENEAPEFSRWCDDDCRRTTQEALGKCVSLPPLGNYDVWIRAGSAAESDDWLVVAVSAGSLYPASTNARWRARH